jgi:hypothetical protein
MLAPLCLLLLCAAASAQGGASTAIAQALAARPPPPCAFYASPAGSDAAPGTTPAAPFLTLARLQAAMRAVPRPLSAPLLGCLRAGEYARQPLSLGPQDGGSSAAAFAALVSLDGPGAAVLSGGLGVAFAPLAASDPGLPHIPAAARGSVLVASLPAAGLGPADYGAWSVQDGFGGCRGPPLELLLGGEAQQPARWPNAEAGAWGGAYATTQLTWESAEDAFLAQPGADFLQWSDVEDVWFHGHWWWDWNSVYARAAGWNSTSGRVRIAPPYLGGASNFSGAARYYALNSLSALDAPREYVLNRTSGALYWLPPPGAPAPAATATVSLTPELITGAGVAYFALAGLGFTASRASAVRFTGGRGLAILNCSVGQAGLRGIDVYGAAEVTVQGCSVAGTGGGGISVSSAEEAPAVRALLQPALLHVADCAVHDFERVCFTYAPGLQVSGTAALVERNEVSNSGHFGASIRGNDVTFRYNVLHHLTMDTFDNAALYFEPNDFTLWNVSVRHNFFYENGGRTTPCNFRTSCLRGGAYMDNGGAGLAFEGNVVYQPVPSGFPVDAWHREPLFVAFNNDGGRSTAVTNNLWVDVGNGTYNSGGGIRWTTFGFMSNASTAYATMRAVGWRSGLFAQRYPELAALEDFYAPGCAGDPQCPPAPFGNAVARNVIVNLSGQVFLGPPADVFNGSNFNVSNNWVTLDPGFAAADPRGELNFQLRQDSPAYGAMGFQRIPMECFGPWSPCR